MGCKCGSLARGHIIQVLTRISWADHLKYRPIRTSLFIVLQNMAMKCLAAKAASELTEEVTNYSISWSIVPNHAMHSKPPQSPSRRGPGAMLLPCRVSSSSN